MYPSVGQYLIIFAATVALELPVWLVGLWRRAGGARAIAVAVGMNAITHPIVYWVFPLLVRGYWPMVAWAELFAVAAETGIVWGVMRGAAWRYHRPRNPEGETHCQSQKTTPLSPTNISIT